MKNIIPAQTFAMICFLVLMENLTDKAPLYIAEKSAMMNDGYLAFGYLDVHNMQKVVEWCAKWHLDLPDTIQNEWELQKAAAVSLGFLSL